MLILTALASVAAAPLLPTHREDLPVRAIHVATKTGKERLSDKASDEQRIDDCKVPAEKRTKPRPTICARAR